MLMRAKRAIAMTTAATIAVTAVGLTPAMSAPGSAAPKQVQAAVDTATDNYVEVASRGRNRHRHYRGGNGGAAALGAFAAIAGTIATLAARDRYDRHRYYEPYPYGYYGRPAPYGYYGQYYAPRYRYYRDW